MEKYILGISLLILLTLSSCEKVEGEGGQASITGKVWVDEYLTLNNPSASYYAEEIRVYIIYGNDGSIFDDDTRTSFDGSYRFEGLRKGEYQVFAYSECVPIDTSCPSGLDPVIRNVQLTDNNSEMVLEDFVLSDYKF